MMIIFCFLSLIMGTIICLIAAHKRVWIVQIAYAATVTACMLTAGKISPITGNVYVSVAIGLYSMSFLLTDYIGEVYGKQHALRAVYMGIVSEIIMLFGIRMALICKAAPFWENQASFEITFGMAPRIMIASISAFIAAQLLDVQVFDWLKQKNSGKFLALRNNVSTLMSQTTDSLIFYTVAFWGIVPNLSTLIITTCIVKYIIALTDTPFIYIACYWAKKKQQQDKN